MFDNLKEKLRLYLREKVITKKEKFFLETEKEKHTKLSNDSYMNFEDKFIFGIVLELVDFISFYKGVGGGKNYYLMFKVVKKNDEYDNNSYVIYDVNTKAILNVYYEFNNYIMSDWYSNKYRIDVNVNFKHKIDNDDYLKEYESIKDKYNEECIEILKRIDDIDDIRFRESNKYYKCERMGYVKQWF